MNPFKFFKNPDPYITIVQTLGTKRTGLTRKELIDQTDLEDNGHLSEILKELEECGFIRRYTNFGFKTKSAVFQLIDSYTLFYYDFIQANTSLSRQTLRQTPRFGLARLAHHFSTSAR